LPAIGPRQAIALPGSTSCPIERTGTPQGLGTGTSFCPWALGLRRIKKGEKVGVLCGTAYYWIYDTVNEMYL